MNENSHGHDSEGFLDIPEEFGDMNDFTDEDYDEEDFYDDEAADLILQPAEKLAEILPAPIMAGLILFCWNHLRHLEEALVSDGHLQFMDGAAVYPGDGWRVFSVPHEL